MNDALPPLPGQHEDQPDQQHVQCVPVRVTIQGQSFYLDKADALDIASTILMTIRSTMINE